VTGALPSARVCEERRPAHGETGVPGSKERGEDVQEGRMVTRKTMVWSPVTEGSHGGRNQRRTSPETEKGTANWRQLGASGLDSFGVQEDGDEAHLGTRSV
jgi:hypothetical protein